MTRHRRGPLRFLPAPDPRSIRAARRLLGFDAAGLARASGMPIDAVLRAEKGGAPGLRWRLAAALEAEGVSFLDNGVVVCRFGMRRSGALARGGERRAPASPQSGRSMEMPGGSGLRPGDAT